MQTFCGMWNEECGMRYALSTSDFVYEYCISVLFSFLIPHSSFHNNCSKSNLLQLIY